MAALGLPEIERARERLAGIARVTPVYEALLEQMRGWGYSVERLR